MTAAKPRAPIYSQPPAAQLAVVAPATDVVVASSESLAMRMGGSASTLHGRNVPLFQQPPNRSVFASTESFAVAVQGRTSAYLVNRDVAAQRPPGRSWIATAEQPKPERGWTFSASAFPPFVAPSIFFVHVDPRMGSLTADDSDFTQIDPRRGGLAK